jgi:PQQ-like domain
LNLRPRVDHIVAAGALLVLLLAACAGTPARPPSAAPSQTGQSSGPSRAAATSATSAPSMTSPAVTSAAALALLHPLTGPFLAPGSDPGVLPGPVIIADEDNNRLVIIDPQGRTLWEFPRPGDLRPGQSFIRPDDVFFTPDGRQIIATQEENQVVSIIDIATRHIVYRYGSPALAGSGVGQLSNPDDAMLLPDGRLMIPDIRNCRVLFIRPGASAPSSQLGTTGYCSHQPPAYFGSPNGVFPMRDGRYLVTEINGDWVNAMSLNGSVAWSTNPPGVAYPSDTNEISAGHYLTVDYSTPGQIVIFNRDGRAFWRYRPSGAAQLSQPSLALPLPNGDVFATDDANHRIIVVDPRTNRVVWQYGHKGIAGMAPGYLANPDGMDLLPPNDLWSIKAR